MVLYDDKKWLIRLIRSAFIMEDDTGLCEKILSRTKPALPIADRQEDDSDSPASSYESYEIRADATDLGHRIRSNTALRLEKMDKQKKLQNLTQVVRVNNAVVDPEHQINFVKDTDYTKKADSTSKQAVSVKQLLQSTPNPELIPFISYARLEASGHPGTAFKRIAIFIPFLPPELRSYPIRVAIVGDAKISDLIGLILWTVSQTYPSLTESLLPVTYYCLQIAEDSGKWDDEFPPIDPTEAVSKFSFNSLALVKCENEQEIQSEASSKVKLSFLLPNETVYTLEVGSKDISLADALVLLLGISGWGRGFTSGDPRQRYHFERKGEPSVQFLDLSISVAESQCIEFCLVRNGAKSVQSASVKVDPETGLGGSPSEITESRSSLYPVVVSTGRFNRVKKALCVIWSGDRMDLEFQHKTKSYSLANFSGVKYDPMKNRVVVSISQYSQSAPMGAHYLTGTGNLTLTALDRQIATELYHHLISIIGNKCVE